MHTLYWDTGRALAFNSDSWTLPPNPTASAWNPPKTSSFLLLEPAIRVAGYRATIEDPAELSRIRLEALPAACQRIADTLNFRHTLDLTICRRLIGSRVQSRISMHNIAWIHRVDF